ncbi:hypothetical protein BCV72DRAFT_229933 [Rhizopus microsporus var. microsporus]|uniref:Uncharacterized protein n=2 Tax=Rhizopus microsporus TaxID=58291 RepID=A0A2G4SIX9_RHIZD|nr:uncharacterized protein RHIMIDRAFT_268461 [Rhizopus microsporus ATCC 52813]ORE05370.1 hypothetical protein BCV72DRAFT_229933 [Rhizopus microsporus var. microsporus]PHZ08709.1 hypothetical protein RHIMIDRAFT_268461 [Rhizopus microsporus ATCC 52813]
MTLNGPTGLFLIGVIRVTCLANLKIHTVCKSYSEHHLSSIMIQLSPYGQRVVLRINLIGMWIAVLVSVRNFTICYSQYRKTKGKM